MLTLTPTGKVVRHSVGKGCKEQQKRQDRTGVVNKAVLPLCGGRGYAGSNSPAKNLIVNERTHQKNNIKINQGSCTAIQE